MQAANTEKPEQSRGMARLALGLSAILFLIYFGNVLAGKLIVLGHLRRGWIMSDVSEFLILLAATTCFVTGTLLLERMRNGRAHS